MNPLQKLLVDHSIEVFGKLYVWQPDDCYRPVTDIRVPSDVEISELFAAFDEAYSRGINLWMPPHHLRGLADRCTKLLFDFRSAWLALVIDDMLAKGQVVFPLGKILDNQARQLATEADEQMAN